MHKKVLVVGISTPLLFWIIIFAGAKINVQYNHLHNTISELGMIGAPAGKFMLITLTLLAILSVVFSLLFFKCCTYFKVSVVPAILSFCMPLSIFWAAIFPMGNDLHDKQGPLPLFLLLAMLSAIILWPKTQFKTERLCTTVAALVLLLIFLRFIKPFGNKFEGLIQRFYYLGWTIWYVSIGILFSKRLRK